MKGDDKILGKRILETKKFVANRGYYAEIVSAGTVSSFSNWLLVTNSSLCVSVSVKNCARVRENIIETKNHVIIICKTNTYIAPTVNTSF